MKKKLFSALIGVGMGIGFAASAFSDGLTQCHLEHFQCVESGQSEAYCEQQYKACRGY